jgi:hypothetical protein
MTHKHEGEGPICQIVGGDDVLYARGLRVAVEKALDEYPDDLELAEDVQGILKNAATKLRGLDGGQEIANALEGKEGEDQNDT